MLHILIRIGAMLIAVVIGAAFGIAGTVAHTGRVGPLPTGIIVGIVGVAAIVIAVRLLTGDRLAMLGTAIGVLVAVLVLAGRGPGGSVLVAQDAQGIAWIITVTVVLLLILAWPSLPKRPSAEPAASVESGAPDPAAPNPAAPTAQHITGA